MVHNRSEEAYLWIARNKTNSSTPYSFGYTGSGINLVPGSTNARSVLPSTALCNAGVRGAFQARTDARHPLASLLPAPAPSHGCFALPSMIVFAPRESPSTMLLLHRHGLPGRQQYVATDATKQYGRLHDSCSALVGSSMAARQDCNLGDLNFKTTV